MKQQEAAEIEHTITHINLNSTTFNYTHIIISVAVEDGSEIFYQVDRTAALSAGLNGGAVNSRSVPDVVHSSNTILSKCYNMLCIIQSTLLLLLVGVILVIMFKLLTTLSWCYVEDIVLYKLQLPLAGVILVILYCLNFYYS